MTDLIDQLRDAPAGSALAPLAEGDPEPVMPRQRFGPGPKPGSQGRRRPKTAPRPFADASPTIPDSVSEIVFTEETAAQLRVLWDDYQERMRVVEAPTTTQYRCLGHQPDGTLCGEIVEAGTREHRLQTGEAVRCPHGPDVAHLGIRFDRERFPQWHVELTPMSEVA